MHERYGQLAKKIAGRALPRVGMLFIEHEIPIADAQAGDLYFVPGPAKEGQRGDLGWLDAMTQGVCLLEMVQSTPGPRDVRGYVRKQLTLDHSLALEAEKQGQPAPPLLHLWLVSAGRPDEVLDGYRFEQATGWPEGFWTRPRLDSMGVVVLNELPRRRDTLLLRLFGRGRVLRDAIADLKALPEDAVERQIALPPLVALRFEVGHDSNPDAESRAFLMATQDLYEQWEKRTEAKGRNEGRNEGRAEGRNEGRAEGLMASLLSVHQDRFGVLPERLRTSLAKKVTIETIGPWLTLFITARSAEEIAAAIRNGTPSR